MEKKISPFCNKNKRIHLFAHASHEACSVKLYPVPGISPILYVKKGEQGSNTTTLLSTHASVPGQSWNVAGLASVHNSSLTISLVSAFIHVIFLVWVLSPTFWPQLVGQVVHGSESSQEYDTYTIKTLVVHTSGTYTMTIVI